MGELVEKKGGEEEFKSGWIVVTAEDGKKGRVFF